MKNELSFLILMGIYSLYFLTAPLYFFKSGLPQISDYIIIILLGLSLLFRIYRCILSLKLKNAVLWGVLFVLWVCVVNLIWAIWLESPRSFVLHAMYYIFNLTIFLLTTCLQRLYNGCLITVTYYSVLFSALLQYALIILVGGFSGNRMVGTFNNPNQLGYYGLLTGALLVFNYLIMEKKRPFLHGIGLLVSFLLVLLSLSKAAIISYAGMFIFYSLSKVRQLKYPNISRTMIILPIIIVLIISMIPIVKNNTLVSAVHARLSSIGHDDDDNLESRGYNRIIEHPEYLVFGAGEGELKRFEASKGLEFHSTVGNILLSYGCIGFILFAVFLVRCLKCLRYHGWYLIIMILFYGLTHNGIRDGYLWVLLAQMAALEFTQSDQKAQKLESVS